MFALAFFGMAMPLSSLELDNGLFMSSTVTSAEFALHPQHETSCDSEIQIKEDLKCKFRKQLGSLALIPLNSKVKEEALECQC